MIEDIMTPKEKKMSPAFKMLSQVIQEYKPELLTEETVESLRFMLKSDVFAPIRDVIADKLIDIGEYFARMEQEVVQTNAEGKPLNTKPKPTRDNRKRAKKTKMASSHSPEALSPESTMIFRLDPDTNILMPVKPPKK